MYASMTVERNVFQVSSQRGVQGGRRGGQRGAGKELRGGGDEEGAALPQRTQVGGTIGVGGG